MPNWLKNTLLVLLSLAIGVGLIEVALRAFVPVREVGARVVSPEVV